MRKLLLLGALALGTACGGKVLDLGRNPGDRSTTTPGSIEADGGPGAPTVLAAQQHNAVAIALDDTRVYWSTGSIDARPPAPYEDRAESRLVRSCVKDNCAATLITYAQSQTTQWIVVDHARVYWAESQGAILACPITGCSGPPTFIANNPTRRTFAVDGSSLYWYAESPRSLQRCSLENCDATTATLALIEGVPSSPFGSDTLALDDTYLYWLEPDTTLTALGIVKRVRKDGSEAPQTIVTGAHQPQSIAVGPTHIVWTEHSTVGAIKACPRDGCMGHITVIASGQSFPHLLASTDNHVYWFASADGLPWFSDEHPKATLFACSLAGCGASPERLATELGWPQGITADARHVYWTSRGPKKDGLDYVYRDGALKRLAWPR